MAENKVVQNPSEQVASRGTPSNVMAPRSLFGPMVPFRDLFGVNPFALMREFTKEMDRAFATSFTAEPA